MRLSDYIDVDKLRWYVTSGLVTARRHNTLPLTIYCYGKRAVYDEVWDDVTCRTRGLIVDDEGNVIARPYEKFFSIDQYPNLLNRAAIEEANGNPPVITEKINGCLGILWRYKEHWGIATKGSFHSPHAEFATQWLKNHLDQTAFIDFPYGYTPVFEIICQEIQPHVIKYPKDGLFLLDLINIETGEEAHGGIVSEYAFKNKLDMAAEINNLSLKDALNADSNKSEGYVVSYRIPGTVPLKLKVKFPTFLKNRKEFYAEQKRLRDLPDPGIEVAHRNRAAEIVKDALVTCTSRKEFAAFFLKPENQPYTATCFALLDYDKGTHDNGQREGSTESTKVG
jgi:hypothetical protein